MSEVDKEIKQAAAWHYSLPIFEGISHTGFEAGAHWAIKRERERFKSKLDEQWAIIKEARKTHAGLGIVEACFRQLKEMCDNE